jgi:hypothetical protein
VLCQLAAPILVQPTDVTRTQYTCRLCNPSWGEQRFLFLHTVTLTLDNTSLQTQGSFFSALSCQVDFCCRRWQAALSVFSWPPPHTRFLDHTQRRATVGRTPLGRVISSSQRPLRDNTQHTQQTNIHATSKIRTHDRSRRAAVDL